MKHKIVLGLVLIGGIGSLLALAPKLTRADNQSKHGAVNPQAEISVTRTAAVKTGATSFYSGSSGRLYTISGSLDQALLKPTRSLSQFRKTTWTSSAYTTVIMPNSSKVRYYQVKNAKTGATGWIARSKLKLGRHYQADQVKTKSVKNYLQAKTGQAYQVTGNGAAVEFSNGKLLNPKQTYVATQKRYFYKHGKKYLYFYVTGTNGQQGWVWHRYLKAGSNQDISQKQRQIKQQLRNYLQSVTKDGTSEVAFYNLAPKAGSRAAQSKQAGVYQQGKLAVNSRGNHVTISASTYKLYVAAYLMHLKQQGKFAWTPANTAGMTSMIVHSTNDFPVSVLNRYGQSNINRWMGTQGYYDDSFSLTRTVTTTANSLEKVLLDLQNGKKAFTNRQDRARILRLMGSQVYRQGIPTGAARANKGTKVQDKVGFLDDNNGDAGIVTLPNGQRYILVILTWGHNQSGFSGYPKIAKVAQHVQQIVY